MTKGNPILLLISFMLLQAAVSCGEKEIPAEQPAVESMAKQPDTWHEEVRTCVYPKASNDIVLNPPPFIVPESMKKAERLQFALAKDAGFSEQALSAEVPWCMWSPHCRLDEGIWYWRFRNVDAEGNAVGEWSESLSFEIKSGLPVFVTPQAEAFLSHLPSGFPRLYCFLDGDAAVARGKLSDHSEYAQMTYRANLALKYDFAADADPYGWNTTDVTKNHVNNLYQAAYLHIKTEECREKLASALRLMLSKLPVSDDRLFVSNFAATNIAVIYAECYDMVRDMLTEDECARAEEMMWRIVAYYYPRQLGSEENHFFDNHFWQHNMRILLQCCLLLHDHSGYGEKCREILEYYYGLWTTRAPNGGFNMSGLWANGTGYFTANVKTLWYVPMLFSYLTGFDFLKHPWYRAAGQALVYSWAPNSFSSGFGDGSEKGDNPDRQRLAFADFLARENGDAFAAWYCKEMADVLSSDVEFRFYRMVRQKKYEGALPANAPKLLWHKALGEVDIHSALGSDDNLALSFRSSPAGTTSHQGANQNSFKLLYRGKNVYRNGGYYLGSGNQAYNLQCYRHSRAHNTILVNGIGQAFGQNVYGQVLRAMSGSHIAYCLGDASAAYRDVTTSKRWLEAMKEAGVEQTEANGYGITPLTKYRRHILVLFPDIVVIYDDLAASEAVDWQWLLHSPSKFGISGNVLVTENKEAGFTAVLTQYSDIEVSGSQTEKTLVPISEEPDPQYPDIWHFTGEFKRISALRIASIIHIRPDGSEAKVVSRSGNEFSVGAYSLKLEMDASRPAEIVVTSSESSAVFSYSAENPVLDGREFLRRNAYSALLYDENNGKYSVNEMMDFIPAMTKTK